MDPHALTKGVPETVPMDPRPWTRTRIREEIRQLMLLCSTMLRSQTSCQESAAAPSSQSLRDTAGGHRPRKPQIKVGCGRRLAKEKVTVPRPCLPRQTEKEGRTVTRANGYGPQCRGSGTHIRPAPPFGRKSRRHSWGMGRLSYLRWHQAKESEKPKKKQGKHRTQRTQRPQTRRDQT